MNPTGRYELVYDEEFDVWDVYINSAHGYWSHGGFPTEAEARAWAEENKNGHP